MAGTDTSAGDGKWPFSDPEVTQIVPLEYYENRQGDLIGTAIVCCFVQRTIESTNVFAFSETALVANVNDSGTSLRACLLKHQFAKNRHLTFKTRKWTILPMKPHSLSHNPISTHAAWGGTILMYQTMTLPTSSAYWLPTLHWHMMLFWPPCLQHHSTFFRTRTCRTSHLMIF